MWQRVRPNGECDIHDDEDYLESSTKKVKTLELCQELCKKNANCLSISYFKKTGWCSHFSTLCTETKKHNNVVSFRLVAPERVDVQKNKIFLKVGGAKTVCDTTAGEVYSDRSPGKVSSVEECKNLCKSDTECQSITYFQSGWCSHFLTSCSKTRKNNKAVAIFRLINAPTSSTTTTKAPAATTTTTEAPATNSCEGKKDQFTQDFCRGTVEEDKCTGVRLLFCDLSCCTAKSTTTTAALNLKSTTR